MFFIWHRLFSNHSEKSLLFKAYRACMGQRLNLYCFLDGGLKPLTKKDTASISGGWHACFKKLVSLCAYIFPCFKNYNKVYPIVGGAKRWPYCPNEIIPIGNLPNLPPKNPQAINQRVELFTAKAHTPPACYDEMNFLNKNLEPKPSFSSNIGNLEYSTTIASPAEPKVISFSCQNFFKSASTSHEEHRNTPIQRIVESPQKHSEMLFNKDFSEPNSPESSKNFPSSISTIQPKGSQVTLNSFLTILKPASENISNAKETYKEFIRRTSKEIENVLSKLRKQKDDS